MSKKRLQRNKEQAVISGVVAGLAEYFEQDPVLFRVVAIGFIILTGIFPGLIMYVAARIIMPAQSDKAYDYEVVE